MAQGATPIVGLRSAAHIEDNAKALALKLTPQDMAQLDEVLRKAKGPAGDIYSFERGG
jgi:aryl-alcohol dehydrogenase-like predicted oxidoreductase